MTAGYGRRVDAITAMLDRLARLDALERAHAPPELMLEELQAVVVAARCWLDAEGGDCPRARRAIERCEAAVRGRTARLRAGSGAGGLC